MKKSKKQELIWQNSNEILNVGIFKLQKASEIEGFDRENIIWVEKNNGEGMDIDLEKIFKNEM